MARIWRIVSSVFGVLLLFGIAFPFIQSAGVRHASQSRTGCMSNMKQLGLALTQYEQDYDETLPRGTNAAGHGWREAAYPYVQSPGVYRCPDDRRDNSHALPNNLPQSYAMNALCFGGTKSVTLMSLSPTAILITDTRGNVGEDWDMTSPAFLPATGCELYTHVPRHLFYERPPGTLNVLFVDGHVKGMQPDATLTPVSLWTRDNAPITGQDLLDARAIISHAEGE